MCSLGTRETKYCGCFEVLYSKIIAATYENSSEPYAEVVGIFHKLFNFRKEISIKNFLLCSYTYKLKINILHQYFNITLNQSN